MREAKAVDFLDGEKRNVLGEYVREVNDVEECGSIEIMGPMRR